MSISSSKIITSGEFDGQLSIVEGEIDDNANSKDSVAIDEEILSNCGTIEICIEENESIRNKKRSKPQSESIMDKNHKLSNSLLPVCSEKNTRSFDIEARRMKASTLLKLKISRTMTLLHEQMEIAETIEHTRHDLFELDEFIEALGAISSREHSVASNFKSRIENI